MIRVNLLVGFSTFPLCESQLGLSVVRGRVRKTSAGVLAYLANQELRACCPWERDDLRISWLTVLHCSELENFAYLTQNALIYGKRVGEMVWEYAFWMYFGKVYEKAQVAWAENRAKTEQYLTALPPKKPAASVPLPDERKKAA